MLDRIFQRGDHLLNTRCSEEPSHLELTVVIDFSDDPLNGSLIGDIQFLVRDLTAHLLGRFQGDLPFRVERRVEDIQTIDVSGVGLEQGSGDAETETPSSSGDDDTLIG